MKVLAKNRRASFDYEITELLVAGLVLTGDEVKSLKSGFGSLKGSFIALRDNEAYLTAAHVTPYSHANDKTAIDPTRARKLLLHRRQIQTLIAAKQTGLSVVPTALLLAGALIKIEIGIGRGKKRYDKRESIKRRDTDRDIARQLKR
ncbi:MAG TPA: SsrA-binding protein SmpB [Candidatus Saccharimonadia bacterium]|nr:SsrA-binding protein SmpB [Candidatus Saccharimonadia bacterium]